MKNVKKRKSNKKHNKRNKSNKLLTPHNTEIENNEDTLDDQQTSQDNDDNRKRTNSDEDSDVEERPKKKKKKNNPQAQGPPSKGKKSNRQIKKEKFAQRQAEADSVAKDALKQQCLSYLSQWKHARDQWKFMKAKQVWLYKNKFSSKLVPDESWSLLLEYFESAKGNIKNMLLADANKIIKQMDDCLEKEHSTKTTEEAEVDEDENASSKPDDITYKRARDIIQHLQE